MRVSRRALMAVARADATVARLTGLCERTVQYALTALGIDEHWQPADLDALLDAMNRRNRRLGLDVPCADDQHNPLGLFIHQARDTLTHDNPHERRLAREHHRAQLIDDQLRRRAETATCAPRLAAEHAAPDSQPRRRERRETLRATLRAAQQHVRTH